VRRIAGAPDLDDEQRRTASLAAASAVAAAKRVGGAARGGARRLARRAAAESLRGEQEVELPTTAEQETRVYLEAAERKFVEIDSRASGTFERGGALLARARARGTCMARDSMREDIWCLAAVALATVGDGCPEDIVRALRMTPQGPCVRALRDLQQQRQA